MNKKTEQELTARETQKIVQRGDQLAHGSRSGHDRRGEERGLDAGRRRIDHREVRTAFLNRVRDMRVMGISASSIAMVLNEEGVTTAQGKRWSAIAIEQLLEVSDNIDRKNAWSPLSEQSATDHEGATDND